MAKFIKIPVHDDAVHDVNKPGYYPNSSGGYLVDTDGGSYYIGSVDRRVFELIDEHDQQPGSGAPTVEVIALMDALARLKG